MAICASGCGTNPVPIYGSNCSTLLRKGGADRLAFINCETPIVEGTPGAGEFDILDTAAWTTFLGTGELAISPRVTFEQGEGSFTEVQTSSKERFTVINKEVSFTVNCYASDVATQTDIDFWNDKFNLVNQGKLRVIKVSCEDEVTVYPDYIKVNLSQVVELDANTGLSYFASTWKYDTDGTILKPVAVSGLVDVLAAA